VCVYAKKCGVVCISYSFFVFFVTIVYIAELHYNFSLFFFTFLKPNLLASLSAEGGQQSVNGWQRASSPALDGNLAATTDRLAKK